jgi:hypothetical protein
MFLLVILSVTVWNYSCTTHNFECHSSELGGILMVAQSRCLCTTLVKLIYQFIKHLFRTQDTTFAIFISLCHLSVYSARFCAVFVSRLELGGILMVAQSRCLCTTLVKWLYQFIKHLFRTQDTTFAIFIFLCHLSVYSARFCAVFVSRLELGGVVMVAQSRCLCTTFVENFN